MSNFCDAGSPTRRRLHAGVPDSDLALPSDPCAKAIHIQIRQTWTGPPPVLATYTVHDLSQLWHRRPATIHVWLHELRKSRFPPIPPYVRKKQINVVRRKLEIRQDYAALIRAIFIDRQISL